MKKIAYFKHQPSGCYWYRIKHPMDALADHGIPVEMIELNKDVVMDDIQTIQVYGIYPFSFEKSLKYLKDEGKRIVYDIDDALDFIDPTNPFYFNVKKDSGSQLEMYKYADHVTVATKTLAKYAKTKTKAPITVIPNCYDLKEWTFPRPKRDGIRIGFAGSCTHVEDLLMVLPAIRNLQAKYDIRFLIMGFGIGTYQEWLRDFRFASPPEGLKALDEFETLMKDIKYEWIPNVEFSMYPATLINMSLDIGLCPVKNTKFNRARSASKAMEYTLAGALSFASDIETYNQDPTSILVKDDEWEIAIEAFINYRHKMKEKYDEHLKWIKENRNINDKVDLLKSIYVVGQDS